MRGLARLIRKLETSMQVPPGSLIAAALRLRYGATTSYAVGGRKIRLPGPHRLPHYQKKNRLYDRFLPYLASSLNSPDRLVIDVGANVGDTVYNIYDFCTNPLLCIEGDDRFFALLQENVAALPGGAIRIVCEKRLVGTGAYIGSLSSNGSTAHLSVADGKTTGQATRGLDTIVSERGFRHDQVTLVKVDTDGFDGDVLKSASRIIEQSRPALFWENQFSAPYQRHILEALYEDLQAAGYDHVWIFDNFGNLMLEECSFKNLADLNSYVASQDSFGCPRAIWYTDVLAVPAPLVQQARGAVCEYRRELIEGGYKALCSGAHFSLRRSLTGAGPFTPQ